MACQWDQIMAGFAIAQPPTAWYRSCAPKWPSLGARSPPMWSTGSARPSLPILPPGRFANKYGQGYQIPISCHFGLRSPPRIFPTAQVPVGHLSMSKVPPAPRGGHTIERYFGNPQCTGSHLSSTLSDTCGIRGEWLPCMGTRDV